MGIILSVSLKVLPRPQCVRTLRKEMPVEKLQEFMARFFREPLPLTATYYEPDRLWIRLSGSEESVGDAVSRLDMDEDVDSAFWHRVRDQERAFFLTEKPLWKVSLPRGFDPKEIPEGWDYVSEWGGAQVWCRNNEVQGLSETATVNSFRNIENERQKQSVYSERLKKAFDPDGILNPGVFI
jgi:glycolate oxidase FAD binding subunit